jgi:HEAT repeat protein
MRAWRSWPASFVILAAFAGVAAAHGGGFAKPPSGGGPSATPGVGVDGPMDPVDRFRSRTTTWETWWADNRQDLLRIAERVDAGKNLAITPRGDELVDPTDPAVRRTTIAAKTKGTVLPVLLRALTDQSDFDIRASAAIALGKLGDASASAPLREAALRDKRDDVRRAALIGLGLLGQGADLLFLCDFAGDRGRDKTLRASACIGIGLSGGDDASQWLTRYLDLRLLGSSVIRNDERDLLGTALAAVGVAGSPLGAPVLRRYAQDSSLDGFFRGHAILSLGRLRDHDSLPVLLRILSDGDLVARRCAATALGRVVTQADAAAVAKMIAAVESESDPPTRHFLLASLGSTPSVAAVHALRAHYEKGAAVDRPFAIIALGVQRDVSSRPLVRSAMAAASGESLKTACFTAAGLLQDEKAVPLLEDQVRRGPMPGTYRGFAALALGVIPSLRSRDILWERLPEEQDPRTRADYATALGLLGDPRVRGYLLKELRDGDGKYEKCTAATCLGILRREDCLPELIAVVDNERVDGCVRALCLVALGQIADPSVVPKLSRLPAGGDSSLATDALAEALTLL